MLPMPSTERGEGLDAGRLARLGSIAGASIRHGLAAGAPLSGSVPAGDPALSDTGASFVTLKQDGVLRGCMGSLEARRALAADVAENAFAAAFRDPRFPPLSVSELSATTVEVSVLTPARPLAFSSEADLLARLRPGQDGVVLAYQGCRATYLPSVWAMLPEPRKFIEELRKKAGICVEIPLISLNVSVYTTIHSKPAGLEPTA